MSDVLTLLAARLAEQCAETVGAVAPGAVAAEIEEMSLGVVPTVLVVPAAERWTPVREAGMRVSAGGVFAFSCVMAMTAPAGSAEWSAARAAIRRALLGWTPAWDEASGPIAASGGRLLAFSAEAGGRWVHAFDFNLPIQATYEHQA